MAGGGAGVSDGLHGGARDVSLAETGPGIPDEAVTPGELRPTDIDAAAVEADASALAKKGWTQGPGAAQPPTTEAEAQAESEAHPS